MNSKSLIHQPLSRRRFVLGASGVAASMSVLPIASAASTSSPIKADQPQVLNELQGPRFDLSINTQAVNFTGRPRSATTVNGSLPGPTLRWREGDDVEIRVTNHLPVDSSVHWHGMLLPSNMDGVPGLSFDGIKPHSTFVYRFKAVQSGTYWYHSHSGFQEQTGLYGAIIVDPADADPVQADRDYVVLLSDWSDEDPHEVFAKLKKESHYYNRRRRTLGDLFRDLKSKGIKQTYRDRAMWNEMRMSDTDLADLSAYTYTYLMNGNTPETGWLGLFKAGEKIRLRVINASAMTIFDVRIPGLKMTVVAADGQNVQPVDVDEFRIGVAETYDLIVEPTDEAYTIFAQSMDRSGYTWGTLATRADLRATIPPMDPGIYLGHRDMGHSEHTGHQSQDDSEHAGHGGAISDQSNGHEGHEHMHHVEPALGKAGFGSNQKIVHSKTEFGPQVDMRVAQALSGLHDPGVGLRDHQRLYGRRVLTYADLRNLTPTRDQRQPSREIQLHLTGNMERYMWSMDGLAFDDAEPLQMTLGERLRIVLANDTMMVHPIHLHGLWSELETGDPLYIPRKHTVIVQPGSTISYLVTADAEGRWAYHCHLMYHMAGMMREVRVGNPTMNHEEGAHHGH